jgi:hypothetical protein
LKMMYQTRNITDAVVNLAHHMSVALRSNDTTLHKQENSGSGPEEYVAPSHRVTGTVYRDQLHVAVRWAWLSLPALLVALVFILLATTIIETRRQKVGIWKDSPLALLLHSQWESSAEQNVIGARTADEIAQKVSGLKATLVKDTEGDEMRGVIKRKIVISGTMRPLRA